jgi:hypothetical protein
LLLLFVLLFVLLGFLFLILLCLREY